MKPIVRLLLITLLAMSSLAARAGDSSPSATKPQTERNSSMSEPQQIISDLFNRWERVWHEGQFDLVPSCVGDHYIRHDESGDRTVTRDAYTAEIAKIRQERPDIRVVVYDHSFEGDRAWFRFAFKWTDTKTGEVRSRAGMQSYRIEEGKLVETWLSLQPLGSTWTDTPQEHWTSPAPIK
jgi:predicted SnoaL-like aldol condensation-catalyzing enzyme